jgi:hypothetical protein
MKTRAINQVEELSPEKLKAEIKDLKKQLDQCLKLQKPKFRFSKSKEKLRFNAAADRICESVFQPIFVFIPDRPGSQTGKYEAQSKRHLWERLEKAIYNADHIDDFWSRREFRNAVKLVSHIHAVLAANFEVDSKAGYNSREWYKDIDASDLVSNIIYFDVEQNVKAFECLIEMLATHGLKDITEEEIDDIVLSLSTMLFILDLDGMERSYLDDKDEDEDEEEEEA